MISESDRASNAELDHSLYVNVYEHPESSIIVPASSPEELKTRLSIFGAINGLGSEETSISFRCIEPENNQAGIFDLQVVPHEMSRNITRTTFQLSHL